MARLTDASVVARLVEALHEWNCEGFIQWKRLPAEWMRKNLEGFTQKDVGRMMHEHVAVGGEIDQVKETREEYRHLHQYHYDFRIPIAGRLIYIETRLDDTKMGPTILVVNMHAA
jgi:hypothetical protein